MSGLVVSEWIEARGGAERVVTAMLEAYPDADLLALWDDTGEGLAGVAAQETWLGRTPVRRHKALAVPLAPVTWRRPPAVSDRHDWVLASSHMFAHHYLPRGADEGIPKLVYVHTPARYVWVPELDGRGDSVAARAASRVLQPIDRRRAKEARRVAANSAYIADRVAATWGVEADVLHPPVGVREISAMAADGPALSAQDQQVVDRLPETFILGASRMIPYKRLERVIEAGELVGVPVVIAGDGPLLGELTERASRARVPVTVVRAPSWPLLVALLARCAAYVFPPVEDFGIMPVEAMAAGAPVVCHSVGGAQESLQAAGAGVVLDIDSDAELSRGVDDLLRAGVRVDPGTVDAFDTSAFISSLQSWVERHVHG